MGFVSDGANVYLGKGKVYLAALVGGVRGGERYVGSCEVLSVTPTVEKKEKKDFALPAAPLLDSAVTGITAEIAMTLAEWQKDNLAAALLSESASDNQTSGTASAEAMNDVVPGHSYKLDHRKVSSVAGLKGATPLVEGTDYDIADADVGLIYIREGGAVVEGDDLTWSYSYAAETAWKIPVAGSTQREFFLRFVGNPTRGKVHELEVWRCELASDGPLDLIGEDYGAVKLKGNVLVDSVNHPTEPYGILRQRA
jgi:hypothetical protein